jgi:protein-S-isoprenylcysteine O-methyltransferase Ste14
MAPPQDAPASASIVWPLAKSIAFVIALPGGLSGYVPTLLASIEPAWNFDLGLVAWLAVPLWATGAALLVHCIWCFAEQARSSPAHFDLPQRLMVRGVYRYLRNPMYVAQLLIIVGHILWFGAAVLLPYLAGYVLVVYLLASRYEEPLLMRLFGRSYAHYRSNVPGWWPQLRPYAGSPVKGDAAS